MIQISLPTFDSYLVLCPHCWDCWARLRGESEFFQHRYVPCAQHQAQAQAWGSRIGGSLLEAEAELLDHLPLLLIVRELQLHLKETYE